MKEEDLEQVCKIENTTFSKPWLKIDFISSLSDTNNIYLVAENENEIAGYCGLWGIVGEGQINNVAVKKSYRGQGIGYKLLKRLIDMGKNNKLTSFTLEVRESNVAAINLYKKLGFQSVGKRKNFYESPREDAEIMWL
jgi:ribosomal-protein-alanine acetyltransferase